MPDELTELHERAEHAAHDRSLIAPSAMMAVLAVFVALVSLLGHRAHTEELISQTKATDQWAFYQAKNIRRHSDEMVLDLLSALGVDSRDVGAKVKQKYEQEAQRYQGDQQDIQKEAQDMEKDVAVAQRKADRFDLGEVALEVALVVTSVTLLTRRRIFWHIGMALGLVGVAFAAAGFLVR